MNSAVVATAFPGYWRLAAGRGDRRGRRLGRRYPAGQARPQFGPEGSTLTSDCGSLSAYKVELVNDHGAADQDRARPHR